MTVAELDEVQITNTLILEDNGDGYVFPSYMSDDEVIIQRLFEVPTDPNKPHDTMGTFGKIYAPNGFEAFSIERPWMNNLPFISCIPPGSYKARLGVYYGGDGVGGDKDDYAAYVLDVPPPRSDIKIHILQTAVQSFGCPGMGDSFGVVDGRWAVMNAYDTYWRFMRSLKERPEIRVNIYDHGGKSCL